MYFERTRSLEERPEGLSDDGKGVKNTLYLFPRTGNPNVGKENKKGTKENGTVK